MERVDTVVVGGGQAGIAASEHLRANGVDHVVLERARIAERWRSERWDSLVANGPAWHDRFPNREFRCSGDVFPDKDAVVQYFVDYARQIEAPIRTGVDVRAVTRREGRARFRVETSDGLIDAQNVIAATGAFQQPSIPPIAETVGAEGFEPLQIHSNGYRNPQQLPDGAVLVVGAGSSGVQIADELLRAGRTVYLSVGPHQRLPRRYRGQDNVWWLGVLGKWNADTPGPGTEHVTIAVSGARGGETIEFRALAERGMTLVGMTASFSHGVARFAPDLADNMRKGDDYYLSLLDEADAHVAKYGLDLPLEPTARDMPDDPHCVTDPILELDLEQARVGTIIWATGYTCDYRWLHIDSFDAKGRPLHQRGVSREPGVYFVGLPWQSRRGSSFIWGVWHDAKFIADQIMISRNYAIQTHANPDPSEMRAAAAPCGGQPVQRTNP